MTGTVSMAVLQPVDSAVAMSQSLTMTMTMTMVMIVLMVMAILVITEGNAQFWRFRRM